MTNASKCAIIYESTREALGWLNMERYRSGHNGADSKSVCLNGHAGSNPALSARMRLSRNKSRKDFLAAFAFENMERGTYGLFEL